MKFWQLASVCRSSQPALMPGMIAAVLRAEARWDDWVARFSRFDDLVRVQDRGTLDAAVPDDLARFVLSKVHIPFYLSSDGWLRSWTFDSRDQALSALEAFDLYGGEVIEDALEKGSCHVR